ncbi:MAG TPA: hypothetical protein VMV00_02980, partial [Candidatus Baltobacteraceae bacterium]|nr:hypothetical protein [Candidatus Baltobacteraceae bacterium]
HMEQELANKLSAFIQENKGKRKFTQSVELAVNFMGVDFSKQDNRLNLEVKLPKGKGKQLKVMIFTDDVNIATKAKSSGATVVPGTEIQNIANDKAKLTEILQYEMLAQPNLMPTVARFLGQFLGPRNKMPKPLLGSDPIRAISDTANSIYLRSKGKYLPTVHCMIGMENMEASQLEANIDEVLASLYKKVGKQNVKSVYVKLTMSKPLKLM